MKRKVDGIIAVGIRRKKDLVAFSSQFFQDVRVLVVGFRFKIASKKRFRIILKQWKIPLVLIVNQQRFVITQHPCKEAGDKKEQKQNQRKISSFISAKQLPSPPCQAVFSTLYRFHGYDIPSKLIRGSTSI